MSELREGMLVLADGTTFEGELIGAVSADGASREGGVGVATGEVVFNTVLSGYQEVITDPSYAGQIITFTYPHIGNYGVAAADNEAASPACRGVIVRDLARRRSNWRSDGDLGSFLEGHGIMGIAGIDTRRLTRHLRDHGAQTGAFGDASEADLLAAAQADPGTEGVDLVSQVTTAEPYTYGTGPWKVVAYDLGMKRSIVEQLAEIATVEVVPASTPAAEVLAKNPDGIFLSNGPGDPEMAGEVVKAIRDFLGKVPVFGICLGHQVLSLALGGKAYKMKFGHHGGNVPVQNRTNGTVEITSQNHNFAIETGSVPNVTETHVCLNDGSLEGLRCNDIPAFSVQYHPEASPGPHDSRYLFQEFAQLMADHKSGFATEGSTTEGPNAEEGVA
jgi:carbamoyl-phosphate synthase small subunit